MWYDLASQLPHSVINIFLWIAIVSSILHLIADILGLILRALKRNLVKLEKLREKETSRRTKSF